MTCKRCNGLMVSERICDVNEISDDLCMGGYRCLLCGELVDAVILKNRLRSTECSGPIQQGYRLAGLVTA